jgi:hypothetical protein
MSKERILMKEFAARNSLFGVLGECYKYCDLHCSQLESFAYSWRQPRLCLWSFEQRGCHSQCRAGCHPYETANISAAKSNTWSDVTEIKWHSATFVNWKGENTNPIKLTTRMIRMKLSFEKLVCYMRGGSNRYGHGWMTFGLHLNH